MTTHERLKYVLMNALNLHIYKRLSRPSALSFSRDRLQIYNISVCSSHFSNQHRSSLLSPFFSKYFLVTYKQNGYEWNSIACQWRCQYTHTSIPAIEVGNGSLSSPITSPTTSSTRSSRRCSRRQDPTSDRLLLRAGLSSCSKGSSTIRIRRGLDRLGTFLLQCGDHDSGELYPTFTLNQKRVKANLIKLFRWCTMSNS